MTKSLWRLDQVHLAPRLEQLSLTIEPGVTAVLGESGAGKTSLLNLLTGFEKPTAGIIETSLLKPPQNHNQTTAVSERPNLSLFWVPQDDGLWPHLTCRGHLQAVCDNPDHWLALFDLTERAHAKPHHLSQGQRNRLSVARALATGSEVLVMDEPLAHADVTSARRYWEIIYEHCRSLIFATHEASRVLASADQVICLKQGQLLAQGSVQKLYWEPDNLPTAQLLGPANWIDGCIRPSQLQLQEETTGDLEVQKSVFLGELVQTQVRHHDGESQTFWHLPNTSQTPSLKPGTRVSLKLLTLCLMALLLFTGCEHEDSPVLPVISSQVWPVPADGPSIPAPRNITIMPNDQMIVLDTAGRVLIYDKTGHVVRQWRMPTNENGNAEGACLLADGRIAVADTHYHRVVFFDEVGNVVGMMGKRGHGPGEFIYPVSVVQDEAGFIYVGEYGGNDRIQKFTPQGQHVLSIGHAGTGPGEFQRAGGMIYHQGKLYVADVINNRILVFAANDGTFVKALGESKLHLPYDVTLGENQTLYVVEYGGGRITQLAITDGKFLGSYGQTGRGKGQFITPWSLDMDLSTHRLYVADTGNRRLVELAF